MIEVDARGMRCPWPALRLAKAARGAAPGTILRLLADDPRAAAEVRALAEPHNWSVAEDAAGVFRVAVGGEPLTAP